LIHNKSFPKDNSLATIPIFNIFQDFVDFYALLDSFLLYMVSAEGAQMELRISLQDNLHTCLASFYRFF
jgi:hypothetical protein